VIYGLITGKNLATAAECGAALAMTASGDTSMRRCGKSRI
jgi:hypothetical protein